MLENYKAIFNIVKWEQEKQEKQEEHEEKLVTLIGLNVDIITQWFQDHNDHNGLISQEDWDSMARNCPESVFKALLSLFLTSMICYCNQLTFTTKVSEPEICDIQTWNNLISTYSEKHFAVLEKTARLKKSLSPNPFLFGVNLLELPSLAPIEVLELRGGQKELLIGSGDRDRSMRCYLSAPHSGIPQICYEMTLWGPNASLFYGQFLFQLFHGEFKMRDGSANIGEAVSRQYWRILIKCLAETLLFSKIREIF
jgi:hypothetical protein